MADRQQYEELAQQLGAIGAVKRGLGRMLPHECPAGSAAVLTLLDRHGEMRMSRLAELMAIDMSVTSRHVAHVAERGWIDRSADPADKRSRILRLTPTGRGMLADLSERYMNALAHYLADWSDDEVDQLSTLLGRLRASFGDCRTVPAPPAPSALSAPPVPPPAPSVPPGKSKETEKPGETRETRKSAESRESAETAETEQSERPGKPARASGEQITRTPV